MTAKREARNHRSEKVAAWLRLCYGTDHMDRGDEREARGHENRGQNPENHGRSVLLSTARQLQGADTAKTSKERDSIAREATFMAPDDRPRRALGFRIRVALINARNLHSTESSGLSQKRKGEPGQSRGATISPLPPCARTRDPSHDSHPPGMYRAFDLPSQSRVVGVRPPPSRHRSALPEKERSRLRECR